MLLDIIISMLINGSVYALLAIGFSLIFGVARIVNIAHTAFYMIAAYFIFYGTSSLGLHPFWGMLGSITLVVLFGLIVYKLIIDPIREHEGTVLIATIALAMAMQELTHLLFGSEFLSVPAMIKGFTTLFGAKITYQQILTLLAALFVLVIIWSLLFKTRLGLAIRSTANDREVANLMGMNEAKVSMITLAVSVGLAAFTGAVVVPLKILSPYMWAPPLVMMMAVVVLGGMGSLKGSFLGAYILALAEAIVVFQWPEQGFLKESVALTIMILVLLIRPEGLYGIAFEEER